MIQIYDKWNFDIEWKRLILGENNRGKNIGFFYKRRYGYFYYCSICSRRISIYSYFDNGNKLELSQIFDKREMEEEWERLMNWL